MRIRQSMQPSSWKMAPFIRLLLPLIAGIIVQKYFPVRPIFLISIFCISLLFFIFCNSISFSSFVALEWVPGIAIHIAVFSFARILVFAHQDIQIEQSPGYVRDQSNCLLLQVLTDPVAKKNSRKCVATIAGLSRNHSCYYENEKVIIYLDKKISAPQISEGCWIIIRKKMQPIVNMNGADFDYKRYCQLRHIYAQVFLKENEFVLIQNKRETSLLAPLDSLRKKLLVIIKKRIPARPENSLLEALMVGFTDDLDPALLKSYADTGVVHIIAISGLHLALICHMIQLALQRTGKKKLAVWIKLFIILGCLWGYSLLSGASPSVIRSAAMFSLTLFARNIFRETVLYNTLAASAFLLLCYDPGWLWDTGFQLSYAAVLSLRLFANPIKDLLRLRNKILVSLWDAASVSIAAQILTTPISIYYFHRFPSYFLFANLLAVPLSSLILLGGIVLCIFSWINPLGRLLGFLLGILIQVMNGFINYTSKLPGAVLKELTLTLPQIMLIYFTLFCFYRFWKMKEKYWLIICLSAICIFQLSTLIRSVIHFY